MQVTLSRQSESDSLTNLQNVVNKEFKYVKKWIDANKLAINVERTNFAIFHCTHNSLNDNRHMKIGNQHVQQAKYVKFLDVHVNENLSWKFHLLVF